MDLPMGQIFSLIQCLPPLKSSYNPLRHLVGSPASVKFRVLRCNAPRTPACIAQAASVVFVAKHSAAACIMYFPIETAEAPSIMSAAAFAARFPVLPTPPRRYQRQFILLVLLLRGPGSIPSDLTQSDAPILSIETL